MNLYPLKIEISNFEKKEFCDSLQDGGSLGGVMKDFANIEKFVQKEYSFFTISYENQLISDEFLHSNYVFYSHFLGVST